MRGRNGNRIFGASTFHDWGIPLNVAFLAYSYHLVKTKSSDFFMDLLQEWFENVEIMRHKEAWAKLPGRHWDLIIAWQGLHSPAELEAFGADRVVLVPMYDACPKTRDEWEPYLGFRVLSFSRTLGDDLKSWGHDVLTVRYWQPVPEASTEIATGLRGFFWPRQAGLVWSHVRPVMGDSSWDSFHLHVTSPEGASALPSEEERARFHIVETSWFEQSSEYKNAVSRANVYFAPRRFEGIGQAVLEAMAMGLCVVSPDNPTMNEYLVHGQTGLLFNPDAPCALDFGRVLELGRNARAAAVQGRSGWEASLPSIRAFLVAPSRRGPKRHPWVAFKGRMSIPLRAVYRAVKSLLGRPVPEEWR